MSLKTETFFSTCNAVFRSFVIAAGIFVLGAGNVAASGLIQQDTGQEAAATADDSLDSLLGKWGDLESELLRLEKEFNDATDPTQQEDLRGKYKALVEQANGLVGNIKTKATEAFAAGNGDEKTARLLVGILKNDAEFGRSDDAIKLGDELITGGVAGSLFETAAKSDKISITTRELLEELFVRFNQHKLDTNPQVKIETSKGDIVIELFEDEAPNTVANFISLVEKNFYDGLKFHRVIEGFVAQGGDPEGDGSGGPGYTIACECYEVEARRHYLGSLSMAHAGKDTGGSQFFICLTRTPNLNEMHTVFGRVIDGIDVLDNLSRNYTSTEPIPNSETDVIKNMEVVRKRDHEYKPVKIGDDIEEEKVETPPAQPETMRKDATESEEKSDDDGESADEEKSEEEKSGDEASEGAESTESESGESKSGDETEESESSEGGGDDEDG